MKQSEAKIIVLNTHSHEAGEGIPNSTLTDIENRLLEAALMPLKTPTKLLVFGNFRYISSLRILGKRHNCRAIV